MCHQSRSSPRHALACLSVVVALVSFARYVPVLHDPWDLSIGSINGGAYTAGIERTYRAVGFTTLRGMPYRQHLPSSPPVPWPDSRYTNHPPLFHWATHVSLKIAGDTESGYRMLPILCTAIAAVLLVRLAARSGTPVAAAGAALTFISIPVVLLHGWIPGYESAVGLFGLATFLGHLRLRRCRSQRYLPVLLALFTGVWIDWIAGTFVLSAATYEILSPPDQRRPEKVLLLAGTAAAAIGSILGVHAWWFGGLDLALDNLVAKGTSTAGPAASWLSTHLEHWPGQIGWPLILGSGAALLMAVRAAWRGRSRLAVAGLALLWPGLVNIVLFRQHAAAHDFWVYYLGIPISLLVGHLLDETWQARRWAAVALALALCGTSAHQGWSQLLANRSTFFVEVAAALDEVSTDRDMLVFAWPFAVEGFYLRRPFLTDVHESGQLDRLKELARSGALGTDRRVLYLFPEALAPLFPRIAASLPRWGRVYPLRWDDLVKARPQLGTFAGPDMHVVVIS